MHVVDGVGDPDVHFITAVVFVIDVIVVVVVVHGDVAVAVDLAINIADDADPVVVPVSFPARATPSMNKPI